MKFSPSRAFILIRQRKGVALVLTLSMLVIASVLLVGFITTSQQNQVATNSYARGIQAQEIANGALEQITGDLRSEIILGSNGPVASFGDTSFQIYQPKTAADAVPKRFAINTTSTNQNNLLRRSAVPNPVDTNASSSANTTLASLDGRAISIARWDKPKMMKNTVDFVAPDWVVVTRGGPKPDATDGDIGALKTNDSQAYTRAIGRYAYTIYDEGGMLNVNTAGFPGSTSGLESGRVIGGKESTAWADLTQIGLSQGQIEDLGNWRNSTTWSNPTDYVQKTATDLTRTTGFTRVQPGDNGLLSRQDLISYFTNKNLPPAALPFLATSSIATNAPSYYPLTATVEPIGRFFLEGKPVGRFPLNDRLKLLSEGADVTAISNFFGLVKAPGWAAPGVRSWIYSGTTIRTAKAAVEAGAKPNFFEVIKSAIINASLSTPATPVLSGARSGYAWEQLVDTQVIRIGANIIDQYDNDNFPTTITFGGRSFYGIEDLPYFSELFKQSTCAQNDGRYGDDGVFKYVSNTPVEVKNYFFFELWNPHQPPVTVNPPVGPTQFRIRADSGKYTLGFACTAEVPKEPPTIPASNEFYANRIVPPNYSDSNQSLWTNWPTSRTVNNQNIVFTTGETSPSQNYRRPHIISDGEAASLLVTATGTPALGVATNGYVLTHNFTLPTGTRFEGRDVQLFSANNYTNVVFVLEYNNGTNWYPYTTFSGLNDGNGTGGLFYTGAGTTASYDQQYNNIRRSGIRRPWSAWAKPDPRTDRLGISLQNDPNAMSHMETPMLPVAGSFASGGETFNTALSNYPGSTNPGRLVTNRGAAKVKDIDEIIRPGDAYLSEPTANPMYIGNANARPVILNRPFRSVGEIGNTFRDQPWKTLNLFSGDSADAVLLDAFCLSDVEKIEGVVSLNSRNPEVLAALLAGASTQTIAGTPTTALTSAQANDLATALIAYTSTTPLTNPSELVTKFMGSIENKITAPFYPIKEQRESIVRALASTGQTRTWNLMIDVIAQSGRFPNSSNVTTLRQFQVEGERRYWMHVAIDRVTGKVISKSIEPVVE